MAAIDDESHAALDLRNPTIASLALRPNDVDKYGLVGQELRNLHSLPQYLQSQNGLARRTWRLFCAYRILFCNGFMQHIVPSRMAKIRRELLSLISRARLQAQLSQNPLSVSDLATELHIDLSWLRSRVQQWLGRMNFVVLDDVIIDQMNSSLYLVESILQGLAYKESDEEDEYELNSTLRIWNPLCQFYLQYPCNVVKLKAEQCFHDRKIQGYNLLRPIDLCLLARRSTLPFIREYYQHYSVVMFLVVSRVEVAGHQNHEDFMKALEAASATMSMRWNYLLQKKDVTIDELNELRQYILYCDWKKASIVVVGVDSFNLQIVPDIYAVELEETIEFPSMRRGDDVEQSLQQTLMAIKRWKDLSQLILRDAEYLFELLNRPDRPNLPPQAPGPNESPISKSTISVPSNSTSQSHCNSRLKKEKRKALSTGNFGIKRGQAKLTSTSSYILKIGDSLTTDMMKRFGIEELQKIRQRTSSVVSLKLGLMQTQAVVLKCKYYGSTVIRPKSFEHEDILRDLSRSGFLLKIHAEENVFSNDLVFQLSIEDELIHVDRALELMSIGFSWIDPNIKPSEDAAALVFCLDGWSCLAALHAKRILHCDVKESNFMYDIWHDRYVLLDFDHSQLVPESGVSSTGVVSISLKKNSFGTRGWYAPELGMNTNPDEDSDCSQNQEIDRTSQGQVTKTGTSESHSSSESNAWIPEMCEMTSLAECYSMAKVLYEGLYQQSKKGKVDGSSDSPITKLLMQDLSQLFYESQPENRPNAEEMLKLTLQRITDFGPVDQVRLLAHGRRD